MEKKKEYWEDIIRKNPSPYEGQFVIHNETDIFFVHEDMMVAQAFLKKQLDPAWLDGIAAGRLLIITPFEATVTRVSSATAHKRNDLMLSLADNATIGYARSGGDLAASLAHFPHLPKNFL